MQGAITQKQFIELLKERKGDKSLKAFAKEFRVSFQFMGKVLKGEYHAGPKISRKMGYSQETMYIPKPAAKKAGAGK